MKRLISFVAALAIMATMFVGFALNVSAASVEAVVYPCNQTGFDAVGYSRTSADSVVMQSLTLSDSWVGISFPGWGNDDGTATMQIYGFDTDLDTSVSGAVLLEETVAINQVNANEHRFATPLAAGSYVIKFSEFAGACYLGFGDKKDATTLTSFVNCGGPNKCGASQGLLVNFITSKDLSKEPITNISVSSVSQISSSNLNAYYTLTSDISGAVELSGCMATIDLKGHTWTSSGSTLTVTGALVTVIDSVGGGMIEAPTNDAITMNSGSLTLDGVKVSADGSGMDAIFVSGGTVNVKNSILVASKAGMDLSQNVTKAPTITVEDSTFEVYNGAEDKARICAFEFRNNLTTIKLVGDNKFNNSTVLLRDDCTRAVADLFTYGEGSSATFSAAGAVINSRWTPYTINYSAPVVVEDPAFAGATVEVDAGISLDFLVSDATEATEVKYNGVALPSAEYSEGVTKYTLSGFGPQEMGDDFTVELFVDGESVDTLTYSVKDYCDAVLADDSASAELKTLVKEMLNYGAKAQIYRNYKTDALVNTGIESTGVYRAPTDYALLKKTSIATTVNWKYATVNFADKIQLIFAFEGTVDKVKVFVGDKTYESTNFGTDAAGVSYVVFEDFTPADFRQKVAVQALNSSGTASRNLEYSVGSYVLFAAQSNDTAFANLAQALMIYGDAVATYVASL